MKHKKSAKKNKKDIENRKESRVNIVLGCLAIVIAFLSVLFLILYKNIILWPLHLEGFIRHGVLVILFNCILYPCLCTIPFLYYELLRHNIKNVNYEQYDSKADNAFNTFINSLYLDVAVLITIVFLFVEVLRWGIIVLLLIFCIIFLIYYNKRKKLDLKNLFKLGFDKILEIKFMKIGNLVFFFFYFCVLIYLLELVSISDLKSNVTTQFTQNGTVEITAIHRHNDAEIEIDILDTQNILIKQLKGNELICLSGISKVLQKDESNSEKFRSVIYDSQYLYKNYRINLSDYLQDVGLYKIVIKITEGSKTYFLSNEFIYDSDFKYSFDELKEEF